MSTHSQMTVRSSADEEVTSQPKPAFRYIYIDNDVAPLSDVQKQIVEAIHEKFKTLNQAFVYETIIGHIVKLPKPDIRNMGYVRIMKSTLDFYQDLGGIRWIEHVPGAISIGLASTEAILMHQAKSGSNPIN